MKNTSTSTQEPLIGTNSKHLLLLNVAVYLDVDQELLEISGRHDDRGVQGDDVAFVQIQVEISSQFLTAQNDTQGYRHGNRQIV